MYYAFAALCSQQSDEIRLIEKRWEHVSYRENKDVELICIYNTPKRISRHHLRPEEIEEVKSIKEESFSYINYRTCRNNSRNDLRPVEYFLDVV